MLHSYLFFIEENFIFRYQFRDNLRFDLLPYSDGSKKKNLTSEFWREWEENSCYSPDDSVDFAFLTDHSLHLETPPQYQVVKPTQFCSYGRIKEIFCKNTLDYPNVKLVYNDREEHILNKRNLLNDQLRTFHLIIPYPTPQDVLQPKPGGDYPFGQFLEDERKCQQAKIDRLHKKTLAHCSDVKSNASEDSAAPGNSCRHPAAKQGKKSPSESD